MKKLLLTCIAVATSAASVWAQEPAAAPIEEAAIIGTWHTLHNLAYEEIVFARNHTYSSVVRGIVTGNPSGTWRIDKDKNLLLIKWTGGELILAGQRKSADNTEDSQKLIKLEGNILTTQTPTGLHRYNRGPLPKEYAK